MLIETNPISWYVEERIFYGNFDGCLALNIYTKYNKKLYLLPLCICDVEGYETEYKMTLHHFFLDVIEGTALPHTTPYPLTLKTTQSSILHLIKQKLAET